MTVKGPKGTLTNKFNNEMIIKKEDSTIVVERPTENKKHKSLHGLTRTLINNMVVGVSEGFEKKLEIKGVGYRAAKQGKKLVMNIGFSHPVEMDDPEGITTEVPNQFEIIVKGIDKQQVTTHLLSEPGESQNHTRVRVSSMLMKLLSVRKVKLVRNNN